jgi:hypothetical protein
LAPGYVGKIMFQLQFDPREIPELAGRYSYNDDVALAAGSAIRDSQFTRKNLSAIFEWKTRGRGRSRLKRNTDKEIEDALRLAVSAKTERAAIAVLVGLEGVAVPVASAILTAIYPKRYTIIDFRALEALGIKSAENSVDFYLCYLQECRQLAKTRKVSLRNLDRALRQWSSERANQ